MYQTLEALWLSANLKRDPRLATQVRCVTEIDLSAALGRKFPATPPAAKQKTLYPPARVSRGLRLYQPARRSEIINNRWEESSKGRRRGEGGGNHIRYVLQECSTYSPRGPKTPSLYTRTSYVAALHACQLGVLLWPAHCALISHYNMCCPEPLTFSSHRSTLINRCYGPQVGKRKCVTTPRFALLPCCAGAGAGAVRGARLLLCRFGN